MATEKQKEKLEDILYSIKDKVSRANAFAIKINAYPDMPTQILDLSCRIDELIADLEL